MYREFLKRGRHTFDGSTNLKDCDLIEFQHSQMFPITAPIVNRIPVVANLHDVYSYMEERSISALGAFQPSLRYVRFWQKFESEMLRRVALTVAVSKLERERCLELFPNARVQVVSNGTDTVTFRPPNGRKRARSELLFCGLMNYRPNIDAAHFFIRRIFHQVLKQVTNCRFIIAGKSPLPAVQSLAGPHVEVTGWVDDVVPYLQRCSVFVAPLRSGRGMRIKVLDALACGAPVVATSIACEGIGLRDGKEILIRDDPKSFAEAVIDLLNHPEKGVEMGKQGRIFVAEKYDWKLKAEQMDQAYTQAIANFQERKRLLKNNETELICAAS